MSRTNQLVLAVIGLVIIIVGALYYLHTRGTSTTSTTTPATTTSTDESTQRATTQATTPSNSSGTSATPASSSSSTSTTSTNTSTTNTTMTVTYKGGTFSPSPLTVAVGSTVTFTNGDTSLSVNVASDPHPTHTDYPPLNIGTLLPGTSGTVQFTRAGTFGYHNHLEPTQTGTIIAK